MEAAGVMLDLAPGRILRHARQHDPDVKARRARRVLDLVAQERARDGRGKLRLLLAAGEAAGDLEDRDAARRALAEAVRTAPRGSTEMLEAYYGWLSSCDGQAGACEHQTAICLEALEIFPLDAQLLSAMGTYLQAQGRLDLAARAFDAAVKFGQVNIQTWHLGDVAEVAAACLGLTLQLLGRDAEARDALEEALRRYPASLRIRRHLVDLHVKHARLDEALCAADPIAPDPIRREALGDAIRGACQAAKSDWTAALGHLQSAYLAGCRDPICLRGLSVVLLSTGQAEAARSVLRQWQEVEPNNAELRAYLGVLQQQAEPTRVPATPRSAGHLDRRLRIDPATTTVDTSAFPVPIISQASSVD
jgi:tetratricopeptide (TPR) repeat protein